MTRIKICGIQQPEHALIAAEAGADYVGVIFAPMSSRRVTPEQALAVSEALQQKAGQARPLLVGVFVNEQPEIMNDLATICGLDLLQLSGDEPWSLCRELSRPAIKALRVPAQRSAESVIEEVERELPKLAQKGGHLLLDSHVAGRFGGTGQTMDWELAAAVAKRAPFFLSGGLSSDNVSEALRSVHSWGVDVSSGVETSGAKDPRKIGAFIRAVQSADAVAEPERR